MIAPFQDTLLEYKGDADTEVKVPGFLSRGRTPAGALVIAQANFRLSIGPGKRPQPLPLVSCLMPTRNRFEQVKLAVASYRAQTWPNKELVVLDQNADGRLTAWLRSLNDPTIRIFPMPGSTESLGALRNRSLELSTGDVVCLWDDDDLQHPARIEIALAAMSAAESSVLLLAYEMLWIPAWERLGILAQRAWPQENTLFARREAAPHYPPLPRGEDTPAVRELLTHHSAVLLNAPELYVYVLHGKNTWDASHAEKLWGLSRDRTEGSETEARLARLERAYPIADYRRLVPAG